MLLVLSREKLLNRGSYSSEFSQPLPFKYLSIMSKLKNKFKHATTGLQRPNLAGEMVNQCHGGSSKGTNISYTIDVSFHIKMYSMNPIYSMVLTSIIFSSDITFVLRISHMGNTSGSHLPENYVVKFLSLRMILNVNAWNKTVGKLCKF